MDETFNKVFVAFLKDIRKTNASFKKILSAKYPIFDLHTDEHFKAFSGIAPAIFENLDNLDAVSDVHIVNGISLGDIMKEDEASVKNYVYTLLALWLAQTRTPEPLVVVDKIKAIELGDTNMDDVFDEDLVRVLKKLIIVRCPTDDPDIMKIINDSKIGAIAKGIVDDIGKLPKQPDMTKMIGTITSKIGEKLQNGEITQEDLMEEAMKLMGSLGNKAPQMKDIMKMFGGGGGSATKDRMRSKLAKKKNKNAAAE